MLPAMFQFIWPSGFREDFKKSANQKQELPMVTMFVSLGVRHLSSVNFSHFNLLI
jgi:hypothetical protein